MRHSRIVQERFEKKINHSLSYKKAFRGAQKIPLSVSVAWSVKELCPHEVKLDFQGYLGNASIDTSEVYRGVIFCNVLQFQGVFVATNSIRNDRLGSEE